MNKVEDHAAVSTMRAFLGELRFQRGNAEDTGRALRALIDAGLDRLPLPGHGRTSERWRALGAVAAFDLSLVKLYEGHTDALAILAELDDDRPNDGSAWAVWAAEPPNARLSALGDPGAPTVLLQGTKLWCSGAASVTHALVTAWNERGEPVLAAVDLSEDGVQITGAGWHAVGMRASASVDVRFERVRARLIGPPRAYLSAPASGTAERASLRAGSARRPVSASSSRATRNSAPGRTSSRISAPSTRRSAQRRRCCAKRPR